MRAMSSGKLGVTRVTAACAVVAIASATPAARAQGAAEQVEAEALFKTGRELMMAGRFAEACPKLAESQRIDPGTGTLLNLATCYERNGQLASAWATYKEAAGAAQNGDQQERAQLARRKAADLEPKLSMLTVIVPHTADLPDLQVRCDGAIIGRPAWGVPIPVDPGAHAIEVTASGKKAWREHASVEGVGTQVSVEVPLLEIDPASESPPQAIAPTFALGAVTSEPATAPRTDGSVQRAAAVASGGIGVAGVVAGLILGGIAASDNNDAKTHCLVDSACDSQGIGSTASAQHAATAATVAVLAGSALVAAGVVLYFTAPSRTVPSSDRIGLFPLAGGGIGGMAVRGGW